MLNLNVKKEKNSISSKLKKRRRKKKLRRVQFIIFAVFAIAHSSVEKKVEYGKTVHETHTKKKQNTRKN